MTTYGGGRTGPSLYEIALEAGLTTKSETEWLETQAKPAWFETGKETWDAAAEYEARTLTYHNGVVWQALVDNTGVEPGTSSSVWAKYSDISETEAGTTVIDAATTERVAAEAARSGAEAAESGAEAARSGAEAG